MEASCKESKAFLLGIKSLFKAAKQYFVMPRKHQRGKGKHLGLEPGSKKRRPGRKKDSKKKLDRKAWDLKMQEYLMKAPKPLSSEQRVEWALKQMNEKYTFYLR